MVKTFQVGPRAEPLEDRARLRGNRRDVRMVWAEEESRVQTRSRELEVLAQIPQVCQRIAEPGTRVDLSTLQGRDDGRGLGPVRQHGPVAEWQGAHAFSGVPGLVGVSAQDGGAKHDWESDGPVLGQDGKGLHGRRASALAIAGRDERLAARDLMRAEELRIAALGGQRIELAKDRDGIGPTGDTDIGRRTTLAEPVCRVGRPGQDLVDGCQRAVPVLARKERVESQRTSEPRGHRPVPDAPPERDPFAHDLDRPAWIVGDEGPGQVVRRPKLGMDPPTRAGDAQGRFVDRQRFATAAQEVEGGGLVLERLGDGVLEVEELSQGQGAVCRLHGLRGPAEAHQGAGLVAEQDRADLVLGRATGELAQRPIEHLLGLGEPPGVHEDRAKVARSACGGRRIAPVSKRLDRPSGIVDRRFVLRRGVG